MCSHGRNLMSFWAFFEILAFLFLKDQREIMKNFSRHAVLCMKVIRFYLKGLLMLTNKGSLLLICILVASKAQAALGEEDLATISRQFCLESPVFLKPLLGGTANAPTYVFTKKDEKEIPFGVLKREGKEEKFSIDRLMILEEMKCRGFQCLPNIIKNIDGEYLTKINGKKYSCFEYLLPDSPEENISFSALLELIGKFHAAFSNVTPPQVFGTRKLDDFKHRKHLFLNPLLKETDPDLFETALWNQIIVLSDFYDSPEFEKIYSSLPRQVIHGDTHSCNVIKSRNQFYLIDFDNMNYDIRLWDLACCISFSFFDEFLEKMANGTCFSFVASQYGLSGIGLELCEKKYLCEIVKFRKMEVMEWFLEMMYRGIIDHNQSQYEQFRGSLIKQMTDMKHLL